MICDMCDTYIRTDVYYSKNPHSDSERLYINTLQRDDEACLLSFVMRHSGIQSMVAIKREEAAKCSSDSRCIPLTLLLSSSSSSSSLYDTKKIFHLSSQLRHIFAPSLQLRHLSLRPHLQCTLHRLKFQNLWTWRFGV